MASVWGYLAARHDGLRAGGDDEVRTSARRVALGLGCLLAAVLAVSGTTQLAERYALAELHAGSEGRLELAAAQLRRVLQERAHLPFLAAWTPGVERLLAGESDAELRARVHRALARVQRITPAVEIRILDTGGNPVAASDGQDRWNLDLAGREATRYFVRDEAPERTQYLALRGDGGRAGYLLAHPIRRYGQLLGFAVARVDLEALAREWRSAEPGVMATDARHRPFLATREAWDRVLPLSRVLRRYRQEAWQPGGAKVQPVSLASGHDVETGPWMVSLQRTGPQGRPRTESYLVQARPIPGPGWHVYAFSSLEPVSASVRAAGLTTLLALLMLLLAYLYLRQRRINRRVRREARLALEASEAERLAIIEGTDAGLVTLNGRGEINTFNPAAERIFGFGSEDVAGGPMSGLLRGGATGELAEFVDGHSERLRERVAVRWESTGVRRNGARFPLDLTVSTLAGAWREAFLATIHDASERKAAEAELRRARDELEQRVQERTAELARRNDRLSREVAERERVERMLRAAQEELIHHGKLAALGQMSSAIAHELSQPLAAIRTLAASARLLAERGRGEEVLENLDEIRGLTDRMGRTAEQLRHFVRKDAMRLEPVGVKACLSRALAELRPLIEGRGVELARSEPDGEVQVQANEVGLERVFVNLLQNALDAVAEAPERRIDLRLEAAAERLEVSVADSGPGIGDEHLPQLFDPFFSTKPVGEGLGLGLALCYGFVEAFGGSITGANGPQGGAVFTMSLPLAERPARADAEPCPSTAT